MDPVNVDIAINDPVCAKYMHMVSTHILFFCAKCAFCLQKLPDVVQHAKVCNSNNTDIDKCVEKMIKLHNDKINDNNVNKPCDLDETKVLRNIGQWEEFSIADSVIDSESNEIVFKDKDDSQENCIEVNTEKPVAIKEENTRNSILVSNIENLIASNEITENHDILKEDGIANIEESADTSFAVEEDQPGNPITIKEDRAENIITFKEISSKTTDILTAPFEEVCPEKNNAHTANGSKSALPKNIVFDAASDIASSLKNEVKQNFESKRDKGNTSMKFGKKNSQFLLTPKIETMIQRYLEFVAQNVDKLLRKKEDTLVDGTREEHSEDVHSPVVSVGNDFDFTQNIKSVLCVPGIEKSAMEKESWLCVYCPSLRFMNDIDFKYHMECHDGYEPNKFKCGLCKKRSSITDRHVKDWSTMRSHLSSVHGINFKLECDACNTTFPSVLKLNTHRNKVHRRVCKFAKQQCKYVSFNAVEMDFHEKCHDPDQIKNFRCPDCCIPATMKRNAFKQIWEHVWEYHPQLLPQRFTCHGCGQGFYTESKYKEHYYECDKVQHVYHKCMFCKKDNAVPVAGLRDHLDKDKRMALFKSKAKKVIQLHEEGWSMSAIYDKLCSYSQKKEDNVMSSVCEQTTITTEGFIKCVLCYKKLKTRTSYDRHMFKCHPEGNDETVCPLCGKLFRTKNQYRTHHLQVHAGKKRKHKCRPCITEKLQPTAILRCTQCDYTTPNKTRMRNHNMSVHMGIYPYKCKKCDYGTNEVSDLRRHENKHLGLKRYKCSKCIYKASQHWLLVAHCKRQHNLEIAKKRDVFNFMGTSGSMRWQRKREKEREARKWSSSKVRMNSQISFMPNANSTLQQIFPTINEHDLRPDLSEEVSRSVLLQDGFGQEGLGKLLQGVGVDAIESSQVIHAIGKTGTDEQSDAQSSTHYANMHGVPSVGNVYNINIQNVEQLHMNRQPRQTVFLYLDQ